VPPVSPARKTTRTVSIRLAWQAGPIVRPVLFFFSFAPASVSLVGQPSKDCVSSPCLEKKGLTDF
jgi:hypothetical protein